jgi:hypothetical protein
VQKRKNTLKTKSKGDDKDDDSEPEVVDEQRAGQGDTNHCPYDRMRKSHCVAIFNSCPWDDCSWIFSPL